MKKTRKLALAGLAGLLIIIGGFLAVTVLVNPTDVSTNIEALDEKAADSRIEALDEKASDSRIEALDEKASDSRIEALDEKASDSRIEALDEKASDSRIEATGSGMCRLDA